MKVQHAEALSVPETEVWSRLSDFSSWPNWLSGLRSAAGRNNEVELLFRFPPNLRLLIQVERVEESLHYELMEGDVSALQGRIDITSDTNGALLSWHLDVMVPTSIPFPLRIEFEEVVFPDWVRRLVGRESSVGTVA
ncbi:MAG: SRPBCC family protein [Proteobacteria bacterium]|nr:SRPBCC family protein [Pseudomonadota bacterium]